MVETCGTNCEPMLSKFCKINSQFTVLHRRVDVIIKAHHNIFKLLGEFSVIVREMILDGLKPSLSSKYRT